jgi:hypothetical protein
MIEYVRLPDDTIWPHPDDPAQVEWRLRYGTPERSDLLQAASYIAAYRELIRSRRADSARHITMLRQKADAAIP